MLALAGCWRDGPGPAPPPLRPEPIGPAREPRQRHTGWRTSDPVVIEAVEAPPAKTPEQIAQALATDLRANGTTLMPAYLAGPTVVLDLDAGTLGVVCDSAAVSAAQGWGSLLTDPQRQRPVCRGQASGAYTCSQWATQNILIIELADPDQWRIVSVIIGNYRAGRSTMTSKISQLRAQIATAACP